MLKAIRVVGFKSIREATVALRPLNVLIGANGSGKSNFIGVFQLLNAFGNGTLETFSRLHGAESFFHLGAKHTQQISVALHMPTVRYEVAFSLAAHGALLATPPQPPERLKALLEAWHVYHFHDTSRLAAVKQSCPLHDNAFLRPDAANLAAFLYLLRERHSAHYRHIVQTVQLVAPFFEDFTLQPDPLNLERIRLTWRQRGTDAYFDAHSLSDGTLRFICLAALLLQPQPPSLILIDEPELSLHPAALEVLAGMLHSAAARAQLIVATQSVGLVNQCAPEDVLVVEQAEGQSRFVRLEPERLAVWLDEYGVGDLWQKNLLGGRPRP